MRKSVQKHAYMLLFFFGAEKTMRNKYVTEYNKLHTIAGLVRTFFFVILDCL